MKLNSKFYTNFNILMVSKIIVFFLILASPLIDFRYASFLNNVVAKVTLLILIIAICFYDFQLAILCTIAFLILIINLNNNIIMSKKVDTFKDDNDLDKYFMGPMLKIPDEIDVSQNLLCGGESQKKNDINNNMIGYYIDPKIKPYEVFISMMTNEENLAKAQGAVH